MSFLFFTFYLILLTLYLSASRYFLFTKDLIKWNNLLLLWNIITPWATFMEMKVIKDTQHSWFYGNIIFFCVINYKANQSFITNELPWNEFISYTNHWVLIKSYVQCQKFFYLVYVINQIIWFIIEENTEMTFSFPRSRLYLLD